MTPDDLDKVLTTLKKHGVSKFKGLELDVELGAATPSPSELARALSDITAKDTCLCGHAISGHNGDGECLQGCLVEVCYPGNEPKPREPEVESEPQ